MNKAPITTKPEPAVFGHSLPPYEVRAPNQQTVPVVFSSPHSGNYYSDHFKASSRLDETSLRGSEDAFVDQIFAPAMAHGAPLLCALFPRAYVDPNREPLELDPAMFEDRLPDLANTRSPLIKAGLGTIARVVTNGEEIYRGKLRFAEVRRRIDACYNPYHKALSGLIDATRKEFGCCLLIDCHSMPSVGGPMDSDTGLSRVDIVLGDRNASSCAPEITALAERTLVGQGFAVSRNDPYAGGYTTANYGNPGKGVHAMQIEINRAIYMDEDRVTKTPGFASLTGRIDHFVKVLTGIDPGILTGKI